VSVRAGEWFYVWMPMAGKEIFWPGLVILGFGVGVIGGFFGIGGGWMATPGLNLLGLPMAFAIGTDLTHMAGKSIISTFRHARFGNVDYRLGAAMVLGTVCGFEAGAQTVMWLERLGKVELYVRLAYLVLLAAIARAILADLRTRRRSSTPQPAFGPKSSVVLAKIRKIELPPILEFPQAGIRCSFWLPVAVGLLTGWLCGLLGIGGGLIRVPALIYLLGCPTHVAVGTDLFEVAISGLYGAATYTYKGRTELVAALIMLVGASAGAQIGCVATKYVHGYRIRALLVVAVAGCAVSIALKLVGTVQPRGAQLLQSVATVLILALVAGLAAEILRQFIRGVRQERATPVGQAARGAR
jgi:uncharacterized membrane protein YfcA